LILAFIERHNSVDNLNFSSLNKPQNGHKLSSTQSVRNFENKVEPHSFRDKSNDSITRVKNGMNTLFEKFKKARVSNL